MNGRIYRTDRIIGVTPRTDAFDHTDNRTRNDTTHYGGCDVGGTFVDDYFWTDGNDIYRAFLARSALL